MNMKHILNTILVSLAIQASTLAWDFEYAYDDINESNADDYITSVLGLQKGSDSVSYWHPISNGVEGTLIQHFEFAAPTEEIFLHTEFGTFDFGSGNYGYGSFWISTDGVNWTKLLDAPRPTPGDIDDYSTYSGLLPAEFTGATELFTQTRLQTEGWNIMAQWSRKADYPAFALNVNVVPEPSALSLVLVAAGVAWMASRRHRRIANS